MTPTNIDEITLKFLTMDQGFVLNSDFHNEKKISNPFHVWDTKRIAICYVYYNKSNLLVCLYNYSPNFLTKSHTKIKKFDCFKNVNVGQFHIRGTTAAGMCWSKRNRLLHETISAGIVSEIKGSNITDVKSHITYTNC